MAAHPCLQFDNIGDMLKEASRLASSHDRQAAPFPMGESDRQALLDVIMRDWRNYEAMLCSVVMAISVERMALETGAWIHGDQPTVDVSGFASLRAAEYLGFCTIDEIRLTVAPLNRIWHAYEESQGMRTMIPNVLDDSPDAASATPKKCGGSLQKSGRKLSNFSRGRSRSGVGSGKQQRLGSSGAIRSMN